MNSSKKLFSVKQSKMIQLYIVYRLYLSIPDAILFDSKYFSSIFIFGKRSGNVKTLRKKLKQPNAFLTLLKACGDFSHITISLIS